MTLKTLFRSRFIDIFVNFSSLREVFDSCVPIYLWLQRKDYSVCHICLLIVRWYSNQIYCLCRHGRLSVRLPSFLDSKQTNTVNISFNFTFVYHSFAFVSSEPAFQLFILKSLILFEIYEIFFEHMNAQKYVLGPFSPFTTHTCSDKS